MSSINSEINIYETGQISNLVNQGFKNESDSCSNNINISQN